MSLVSEIIARLEAIDPPAFAMVAGAIALAAVKGVPDAVPAAFVFVKEEASAPTHRATGPVLQRVEADVAVLIVAGNVSDAQGAAVAADLEDLKDAVRAALVGFVPTLTAGEPLQHVSGQLVQFKGGYAWHEDLYSAVTHIEEQT